MRNATLILLPLLLACATEGPDQFGWIDEPVETVAFSHVVGQSDVDVTVGDFVVVYIASDAGSDIDWFDTISFLSCDTDDWSIEHTVTTYVASVDLDGKIGEGWVVGDDEVVSAVGFTIADRARTGPQMVVDPFGDYHLFDLVVDEPVL